MVFSLYYRFTFVMMFPLFLYMHVQVAIPSCILHHYDISIIPEKCPRRVNREIVETLVQVHGEYFGRQKPVFDGRKNLYCKKPLPIGRDKVCTEHREGPLCMINYWYT